MTCDLELPQAGTAAPTLSFWEATLDLVIFVIAAGAHWLFTWARDVQRYRRAVVRQEAEPDWPQPMSKMIQYVRLPGYWGALLFVALPLLVLLPSSATSSALSPEPRDGIPYPALLKGVVVGGPAMFLMMLAWACQPQSGPYNARSPPRESVQVAPRASWSMGQRGRVGRRGSGGVVD